MLFFLVTLTCGHDEKDSRVKVSLGSKHHSSSSSSASASSSGSAASSSSSSSSAKETESRNASTENDDEDDDDDDDDDDYEKSSNPTDRPASSSGNSIHQSAQFVKLRQTLTKVATKVASNSANLFSTFGDHFVGIFNDLTNRI